MQDDPPEPRQSQAPYTEGQTVELPITREFLTSKKQKINRRLGVDSV